MSLTLIELLGVGGFILGITNLILLWAKYRKDKPIITIKKKLYKKYLKFEELNPKEYNQAIKKACVENPEIFNQEYRNLIVDITNKGHRDAKLKSILPLYKRKGKIDFSPRVINFHPTTINAGDRKPTHLFFEFPPNVIEEIEKTLPNIINIEFDFAHKKIKKKFKIGKSPHPQNKYSLLHFIQSLEIYANPPIHAN